MSYNDGQVDASARERRLVQDRARLRAELRAEFMKQSSNPYRHMSGEGGYLFDPAMQRWMSMRANEFFTFKPTPKTLLAPLFLFGSIGIFAYILKTSRDRLEHKFRTGQISYSARENKFT